MSDKKSHQQEIAQKLHLWQRQVEDLGDEIQEAAGDQKEALEQRLQELHSKLNEARNQLQRLQQAGASEYEGQKQKVDRALEDLKKKFGGMG